MMVVINHNGNMEQWLSVDREHSERSVRDWLAAKYARPSLHPIAGAEKASCYRLEAGSTQLFLKFRHYSLSNREFAKRTSIFKNRLLAGLTFRSGSVPRCIDWVELIEKVEGRVLAIEVIVLEWIDGVDARADYRVSSDLFERCGRFLQEVSHIPICGFGANLHGDTLSFRHSTWRDALCTTLSPIDQLREVLPANRFNALRERFEALKRGTGALGLAHADLIGNFSNIIRHRGDDRLSYIDWDNCFNGEPLIVEIGFLLAQALRSGIEAEVMFEIVKSFIRGWGMDYSFFQAHVLPHAETFASLRLFKGGVNLDSFLDLSDSKFSILPRV